MEERDGIIIERDSEGNPLFITLDYDKYGRSLFQYWVDNKVPLPIITDENTNYTSKNQKFKIYTSVESILEDCLTI